MNIKYSINQYITESLSEYELKNTSKLFTDNVDFLLSNIKVDDQLVNMYNSIKEKFATYIRTGKQPDLLSDYENTDGFYILFEKFSIKLLNTYLIADKKTISELLDIYTKISELIWSNEESDIRSALKELKNINQIKELSSNLNDIDKLLSSIELDNKLRSMTDILKRKKRLKDKNILPLELSDKFNSYEKILSEVQIIIDSLLNFSTQLPTIFNENI